MSGEVTLAQVLEALPYMTAEERAEIDRLFRSEEWRPIREKLHAMLGQMLAELEALVERFGFDMAMVERLYPEGYVGDEHDVAWVALVEMVRRTRTLLVLLDEA